MSRSHSPISFNSLKQSIFVYFLILILYVSLVMYVFGCILVYIKVIDCMLYVIWDGYKSLADSAREFIW